MNYRKDDAVKVLVLGTDGMYCELGRVVEATFINGEEKYLIRLPYLTYPVLKGLDAIVGYTTKQEVRARYY